MRRLLTKRNAISIGEAVRKVMSDIRKGSTEKVALDSANGRYLAEDIVANQDVPAFDRSLYDGYAIRSEDTKEATIANSVELEVVGHIGAGAVFTNAIQPFQAVRIMTGAEMPAGGNAVVMLEHVQELNKNDNNYIAIDRYIPEHERVFKKGREIQNGTYLVKKGTRITPGIIGLLATFGYSEVLVGKKPVVGVLATGSELLEIDEPLVPGKIRNSNSYMLMSQIERVGAQPKYLGKLEDDLEKSFNVIQQELQDVDILITTGGVSVGDYDYLPEIYERLGATVLFNKIAMRPGSVTTVAKLGHQFLFGLSGNPSASFIGFELFVRPVIRTMLENKEPYLASQKAILADSYPKPNAFAQLIRTKIEIRDSNVYVTSNGLNMSSSITSLVGADALVVLPPTESGYEKGDVVDILLLADKGQEVFSVD